MGSGGVGKSAITIRFVNRQFEAKVKFFELITSLAHPEIEEIAFLRILARTR